MSSSGSFRLIINDGKADKILNSSDTLLNNIGMIKKEFGENNFPIKSIEKTHKIFIHNKFKPYVKLSFEYSKVLPQGDSRFGKNVIFSIPRYGDFLSDAVIRLNIEETPISPIIPPAQGNKISGPTGETFFPRNGYDWDNTTRLANSTYSLVDIFGDPIGDSVNNLIRYCDYPGERMVEKASFQINTQILEEYNYDSMVMHRMFNICEDKLEGYKKLIGQETQNDFMRGLQTPKYSHSSAEIWIPLLFWFNRNSTQSLPILALPYGNITVNLLLASTDSILSEYPGVYIKQVISKNGSINQNYVISEDINLRPFFTHSQIPELNIESIELYINNIFIDPIVHDIFIFKVHSILIRLFQKQYAKAETCNKDHLVLRLTL